MDHIIQPREHYNFIWIEREAVPTGELNTRRPPGTRKSEVACGRLNVGFDHRLRLSTLKNNKRKELITQDRASCEYEFS